MARYRSPALRRARRRLRSRDGRLAGSAAAAGVIVAIIAGHPHPGSRSAVSTARTAAARTGGTLDCPQLEALWKDAGGSPAAAFMAAEIATAESGGSQYATDDDSNGTTDEGYWQINTSHGALATYDPHGNARAAVIISGDGTDWTPWTTYQTGAYAGKC